MKPLSIKECGCCESEIPPTPQIIYNRPGLLKLTYRVGTFFSFRQAMIESIAKYPELINWTVRQSDDYGIALFEMWATIADILTFYQERIANEAFLKTAVYRDAVLRFSAMLDYKLNPGVAASTCLVFFAEDQTKFTVSVGLRVQSVPEDKNEKPQKFETIETILAESTFNKIRIFPQPQSQNFLNTGKREAILQPDVAEQINTNLSPNDNLIVVLSGCSGVEEKKLQTIRTKNNQIQIEWTPEIESGIGGEKMFKWIQKYRLFGCDAPKQFYDSTISAEGAIKWQKLNTDFSVEAGNELHLDAIHENLKTGVPILITTPNTVLVTKITAIKQTGIDIKLNDTSTQKGPLSSTVTKITTEHSFSAINDLRQVTIYELAELEITFWNSEYPAEICGNTVYVQLQDLKNIPLKRTVMLDDGQTIPQAMIIKTVGPVDADGDGFNDHLQITFASDLKHSLNTQTARLYGNTALATHGETVSPEILGGGNSASDFQSFGLKKSPLTYVPDPNSARGTKNTLQLRVNGILWQETDSLFGKKPDDQLYVIYNDEDEKSSVQFGDGKTGARLPTGLDNVVATYRQGLGAEGNVSALSLQTALDRPLGLKSVFNPKEAEGGTDPESINNARTNAPNTVRTFDRAISLRDYEDMARSYTGIAKAKAVKKFCENNEIIQLTIAGDNAKVIETDSETYKNFRLFLDNHRDNNHLLSVIPHEQKWLKLQAIIQRDSVYLEEIVLSAVQNAVLNYVDFNNLQLGQSLHVSDIYAVIQAMPGVVATVVKNFHYSEEIPSLKAHLLIKPNQIAAMKIENMNFTMDLTIQS